MNREIKFRVFGRSKTMIHWHDLQSFYVSTAFPNLDESKYDYHIMQYTGLKDKNGKEIYEFDVIIHNDNQYVIRYSVNLGIIALATTKEYSSFEGTVKRNHRYRDQAWLYNVQKYLSVIGNIFENPELLI